MRFPMYMYTGQLRAYTLQIVVHHGDGGEVHRRCLRLIIYIQKWRLVFSLSLLSADDDDDASAAD